MVGDLGAVAQGAAEAVEVLLSGLIVVGAGDRAGEVGNGVRIKLAEYFQNQERRPGEPREVGAR